MSAIHRHPAFLAHTHAAKDPAHIAIARFPELKFMGISQYCGQRNTCPATYLAAFEIDANLVGDFLSVHAYVCR
jgi:hypothetical protein